MILRHRFVLNHEIAELVAFPFDHLNFKLKWEMSGFVIEDQYFRFDFHLTTYWKSIKEDADNILQLDINYPQIRMEIGQENKKFKTKLGVSVPDFYYPVVVFHLPLIRVAMSECIRSFIPAVLIRFFMVSTYFCNEYDNALANISIGLLTFISLI